jgi:hypothetical protein
MIANLATLFCLTRYCRRDKMPPHSHQHVCACSTLIAQSSRIHSSRMALQVWTTAGLHLSKIGTAQRMFHLAIQFAIVDNIARVVSRVCDVTDVHGVAQFCALDRDVCALSCPAELTLCALAASASQRRHRPYAFVLLLFVRMCACM